MHTSNKIRILHYLNCLDLGGTTKTAQLFFEHATRDEFDVHVAFNRDGDMTRLDEFLKGAKVCGGTLHGIEKTPEEIQGVIDENAIDILHVYRSGFEEFPEPGIHVNVPHFVETNVFGFIDPNPRVTRTLFMSKWLMQYAARRNGTLPYPRFDFVNNPVEEPWTNETLNLPFEQDAIVLGRCGRPDNGIYNSVSIRAARNLRMQGYNVCFVVVAPPENMVHDLVTWEVPFHVIEPTTSQLLLSQFYNSVDIYAHARADGETFGVNIAEAMMHGKPVVTHIATPSHPGMGVFQSQTKLVSHDVTGYVVNNDPGEYTEAIKKLIDDVQLRQRMGLAGKQKAMLECEVTVCVDKLENIYRDIMTCE